MASFFGSAIPKFALTALKVASNTIVIGRRGTGTSLLVEKILEQFGDDADVTYIRGEDDGGAGASTVCGAVLAGATQRASACNDMPHTVVVLDRLAELSDLAKRSNFRRLLTSGRRHGVSVIIVSPYPICLGPHLRDCVDYAFAFGDHTVSVREHLRREYYDVYASACDFATAFEACTEGGAGACMVRDNTGACNSAAASVMYYCLPAVE